MTSKTLPLFSTFIGMTVVALMTGCSGADAGRGGGHAPGTAGSIFHHAAAVQDDNNIAGVLQWSGDSSGRHVYKTADCAVFPGSGGPPIIEAPKSVEKHPGMLAKLDQPWLKITFIAKKGVDVKFNPQPRHQTHKNSFSGSEKSAGSVSWSKKGGTYVVHLQHIKMTAGEIDFTKEKNPEYHTYLTGDLTCTKVNGTKVSD